MREKMKSRKIMRRHRIVPYNPLKEVMSQQDANSNGDIIKDFQSTGRTGRRNAMPDVHGAHKDVSTSDLPLKLEKLTTNDDVSVPEAEKANNGINNSETEAAASGSSTSTSSST